MRDDALDDLAGECARDGTRLVLGELPFEDRPGGPLAEVGLEDRGERDTPPRAEAPDPVGPLEGIAPPAR